MELITEIFNKYNFERLNKNSLINIGEIEASIKFRLPDDYRYYLENYLGFEGFIGEEFVRLWDVDEILDINKNYGVIENLPNTIAIGSNGASEFVAIELINNGNFRVVLSSFIDLDINSHVEVGESFKDFLIRLDYGKAWFKNIN